MTTGQGADSPERGGSPGRAAQRRRTREAILTATQRLLAAGGGTPSIEDIAAAADVSRRTIYMYFPTLDQLVVDATSGLLSERTIEPMLAEGLTDDVVERVDTLARALLAIAPEALPLGRRILSLTVDAERPPDAARRGYRRIEWIERAVEPLRAGLSDEQHRRLVSSLALVLGWEAMILLRDVCGLEADDEESVMRWAARTLVTAMVAESAGSTAGA